MFSIGYIYLRYIVKPMQSIKLAIFLSCCFYIYGINGCVYVSHFRHRLSTWLFIFVGGCSLSNYLFARVYQRIHLVYCCMWMNFSSNLSSISNRCQLHENWRKLQIRGNDIVRLRGEYAFCGRSDLKENPLFGKWQME